MLIRFSVRNHLSIRDEQEISLVASSLKDRGAALISLPNSQFKLLPAAVIYGANASGKSNFITSCAFLSNAVRYSHERGSPGSGVPRKPFLLDKRYLQKPSVFDIEFAINGVRYEYGFSCNDNAFLEEWLHAFPSGKQQTWFRRESNKKRIYFGKQLKGQSRTIESLMRPNSLYLSVAAQNAHEQLTPLYKYLTSLSMTSATNNRTRDVMSAFLDGKCDRRILDLLKRADTGISGFRFEPAISTDKSSFTEELNALLKKHVKGFDPAGFDKVKKLSLAHSSATKEPIYLDMESESSGTIRLLILFKAIFEALDEGTPLLIDEIDASLHTYLVEDVVALFNSSESNKKGAQLIATTHDTNLLCGNLLRRDQIWFAEKDKVGATAIYPLTDIRTRNTDNIEKGYLEGRFGAVPFRGRIDLLINS